MKFLDDLQRGIQPRYDDDFVDRMNYYWTGLILIALSLTLMAKQYVGQPLQCWVPAQFTGAWEQYTENYCFVQNTYFLPLTDPFPKSYKERDEKELGYYQWVGVVLALMAVLFYIPCALWRLLNWQSGINVKSIIKMAIDVENIETEKRDKNVECVARHVFDALELQRELKGRGRLFDLLFYGKHYGAYISGLYIFTKLLYCVNIIGQFFILNSFLGFPHYKMWGFEVLSDLVHGREWQSSGHFPRVTMCYFEVRVLGAVHPHTVQCVIMINMFNEKVFLFLWWWFAIIAIVTLGSFIYWVFMITPAGNDRDFIKKYLRIKEAVSDSPSDRDLLNRFVKSALRPDGVFLLRIVAANAGDILCADLIDALFLRFKDREGRLPEHPLPIQVGKDGEFAEHYYPVPHD